MSLPKAVQEAEQKAEAMYQHMYNPQEGNADADPAASQETEPADEPAANAGIEVPDSGGNENGSHEESAPTTGSVDGDSWENRYRVLSGKYSAEVPALAAERRELRHKVQELEAKIEKLATAPAPERLVKDEEIQEYGENLIDVIRRAAREEVASKDAEIADLRNRLEGFDQSNQKRVVTDYYQRLGELVPDWLAVNDNKNFHKWLSGRDDLTGQERQELLDAAHASQDPARVAAFFNAWKRATESMVARANQSLESQVTPDASVHDTPPPGKRAWTRQQVADFYSAYRRGEIPDDQALAIESDIQMASAEGRIR